jgi:heptosyltransferase-3
MLRRFRRHRVSRRFGGAAGRLGRQVLGSLLDAVLPGPGAAGPDALGDVRRVLLVRANFRIGNALMATPLVLALRDRFPGARVDVLVGDTVAPILARLPIDRVYTVSRLQLLAPWRFVALFARLRRERYDVAIEGGFGSFSGGLYAYLTGARHRVGCAGKADRFLTVRLAELPWGHAYDAAVHMARELGVACSDRPVYRVGPEGAAGAARVLESAGLARGDRTVAYAVLFVGGHEGKRWSADNWLAVAQRLRAAGRRVLIALGPEELASEARFRAELPAEVAIVRPQAFDVFAGILDRATLVATPDSGPMHFAVALGTPTIAVLQAEKSRSYAPRGADDRVLVTPSAEEVALAAIAHPAWGAAEVAAAGGVAGGVA